MPKKTILQCENDKIRVLEVLRSAARVGEYWMTVNAIAREAKVSNTYAKEIVIDLLGQGFLEARDGDTEKQWILVSLRKILRDER